jgi:hypothetical protein
LIGCLLMVQRHYQNASEPVSVSDEAFLDNGGLRFCRSRPAMNSCPPKAKVVCSNHAERASKINILAKYGKIGARR